MDGVRFDAWTRRRFGLAASGLVASVVGLAAVGGAAAETRRCVKKPGIPCGREQRCCRDANLACGRIRGRDGKNCCRPAQGDCRDAGDCCDRLGCGSNGVSGVGDVCIQKEGGPCEDPFDCGADFNCSERDGDTCQRCSGPAGECSDDNGCCLNASVCATGFAANACGATNVCCQLADAACDTTCQCCANHACINRICTFIGT